MTGCPTPQRIATYSLSSNRQRPLAGAFHNAIFNTFRRCRHQVLYVAPPFLIAYATMNWAVERYAPPLCPDCVSLRDLDCEDWMLMTMCTGTSTSTRSPAVSSRVVTSKCVDIWVYRVRVFRRRELHCTVPTRTQSSLGILLSSFASCFCGLLFRSRSVGHLNWSNQHRGISHWNCAKNAILGTINAIGIRILLSVCLSKGCGIAECACTE